MLKLKIVLYYFLKICYIIGDVNSSLQVNKLRWCSILVRSACSQDGPKKPLKGTSMKFLVLAFDASRGLVLGVKV